MHIEATEATERPLRSAEVKAESDAAVCKGRIANREEFGRAVTPTG